MQRGAMAGKGTGAAASASRRDKWRAAAAAAQCARPTKQTKGTHSVCFICRGGAVHCGGGGGYIRKPQCLTAAQEIRDSSTTKGTLH